jgi:hypothetical protein
VTVGGTWHTLKSSGAPFDPSTLKTAGDVNSNAAYRPLEKPLPAQFGRAKSLSTASFNAAKEAGFSTKESKQEQSAGRLPEYMTTGVEGDRILMICAISAPVMPDIVLSVTITSWTWLSKCVRASSALENEWTMNPKYAKNNFVMSRV